MTCARQLLITGATGLVGSRTLALLLQRFPDLGAWALVRDPARWRRKHAHGLPAHRVTPLQGDVTLPGLGLAAADRSRVLAGVRTVLHAAADTCFSRPLPAARAVNLEGTRNVLELAAACAEPPRFVHVSTAFVAGRRVGAIPEEAHPAGPGWVNAYEQSKHEAEEAVRRSGLPWVVVRPSTIVCDDGSGVVSQMNAVHRALHLHHAGLAALLPGEEDTPVDLVTNEYVSGALAELAFAEWGAGRTLHLCAGRGALPLGELLDLCTAFWSECPTWRRKGIARPALTDLETWSLFERTVEETGDLRLRRITRSLSHFVPQLALPKRFDTTAADTLLGRSASPVRTYCRPLLQHLLHARPGALSRAGRLRDPMTKQRFIDEMLDWLSRRLVPGREVAADTPLFESGLIDSIKILKLIAWTERATGRRIPDAEIRMDNFRTVATIARVFLREEAA